MTYRQFMFDYPVETENIREKWDIWGEGVRFVILESPYRLL